MPESPPEVAAAALSPGGWAEQILERDRDSGLLRHPRSRAGGSAPRSTVDGRAAVVFSSNDYLGLSVHPEVVEAASRAARDLGVGATGSRHLSGGHEEVSELEAALCDFESSESATVAPTGYAANMAALQAVGGPDAVIFSDEGNHASIIDGCRASRASVQVYRHGDLSDLEARLSSCSGRPVIVSDSVFSMDGGQADVAGLARLAGDHSAWLILDEAHATGVVGPGGRGGAAAAGLGGEPHVVRVVTFSKALGAGGGAVCGSRTVGRLMLQRGRALIFSTGLPHPTVAAATAAIRVLKRSPELVDALRANARILRDSLGTRCLPAAGDMPIAAVVVGDAKGAVQAEQQVLEAGYLAQAVRPPTVPPGTSRLRIVASALHTDVELRGVAAAVLGAIG
jgi:8-amino-7-oxononanoate synthase